VLLPLDRSKGGAQPYLGQGCGFMGTVIPRTGSARPRVLPRAEQVRTETRWLTIFWKTSRKLQLRLLRDNYCGHGAAKLILGGKPAIWDALGDIILHTQPVSGPPESMPQI
ncbi:hypothetical protein CEXT_307861, partial [Caerostris extrusa]